MRKQTFFPTFFCSIELDVMEKSEFLFTEFFQGDYNITHKVVFVVDILWPFYVIFNFNFNFNFVFMKLLTFSEL